MGVVPLPNWRLVAFQACGYIPSPRNVRLLASQEGSSDIIRGGKCLRKNDLGVSLEFLFVCFFHARETDRGFSVLLLFVSPVE